MDECKPLPPARLPPWLSPNSASSASDRNDMAIFDAEYTVCGDSRAVKSHTYTHCTLT